MVVPVQNGGDFYLRHDENEIVFKFANILIFECTQFGVLLHTINMETLISNLQVESVFEVSATWGL